MATPSATDPGLTSHGWKNLYRGLSTDAQAIDAIARYLTEGLGHSKVCVLSEAQEDIDAVTDRLGAASDENCSGTYGHKQSDFVQEIESVTIDLNGRPFGVATFGVRRRDLRAHD
jgi:branched-chain amino acid transport system substrate-binding protein